MQLRPDEKISVEEILKDLDKYRPRRRGWTWRNKGEKKIGPFEYYEVSDNLKNSIPLATSHNFENIDPQPDVIVTVEIASGRFEEDIKRMRMAAWHGADHIMVIRTLGQSHFDGLIEGTPEGVGGVPITRKQIRATRKALDLIEDEVGRPINFHSYVSGLAGPEIATLFVEEGVNGAHQDPQYNILYRNINPLRSFVDAAEAKKIMAYGNLLQIDGAHNANATARKAWKVLPELLVQHAINCMFSLKVGMKKEYIALSTVPPTTAPAPSLRIDLPYAIALRKIFKGFRFRAQMNTRYITSDVREAIVNHTLNVLISRLTSCDIQSTITPDEGRHVPWHQHSIFAVETAKQALIALDGIKRYVNLDSEELNKKVREIMERAVLFLEDIKEVGYLRALELGYFVDSGYYPEREGDGIVRSIDGGIGTGTIVERDPDYFAPVCAHFGRNNLPEDVEKPCDLIGGCTLCNPEKIVYIDELDSEDNVEKRLEKTREVREKGLIKPEVEWTGDGYILLSMFIPEPLKVAESAGLLIAKKLGLEEPEIVHRKVLHPAEGTFLEIKAKVPFFISREELEIREEIEVWDPEKIREEVRKLGGVKIVAATVGEDEHSAGIREIIDLKHGGLEAYGFDCHFLGTSVKIDKLLDAGIEIGAHALLLSTIVSHGNVHILQMKKIHQLALEKGVRNRFLIIAGGPQVNMDLAISCGLDGGFGRGTKGIHVATYILKKLKEKYEG